MTREGNEVEQAVARTVRDSLEKLQRTTEELHQAINDLAAACGSTRPSNALPPMMRAQTAAASLAASLEVLSRFVASSLQMSMPPRPAPSAAAFASPEPRIIAEPRAPAPTAPTPRKFADPAPPAPELVSVEPSAPAQPPVAATLAPTAEVFQASDNIAVELPGIEVLAPALPPEPEFAPAPMQAPMQILEELPPPVAGFDVMALPAEEQELHRRANRVAKVSMQDIKLLRPNDVKLGREQKDLCVRLRDDIEKAHKEYDRRFQSILGHPVDYFYDWMVQILGDGNPEALGHYPYPSRVLRH